MTAQLIHETFAPNAISDDTRAVNSALSLRMNDFVPAAELTDLRGQFARGEGAIPSSSPSAHARVVHTGPGDSGVPLRIMSPPSPDAVYLHIHGGAWMLGNHGMWDDQFERIERHANVATVSVGYRLAPEHPFPAAADDCETAARWLLTHCLDVFGTDRLIIGGESAGAHLAVLTLLRLRDAGEPQHFVGANLMFGVFDLSGTPSVLADTGNPVIPGEMILQASALFRNGVDARDSRVSPLYADLRGMPRALLSVGTLDPLLDDSLFMHSKWTSAGNAAELCVYPGGLHGFTSFGGDLAGEANARADAFMAETARMRR